MITKKIVEALLFYNYVIFPSLIIGHSVFLFLGSKTFLIKREKRMLVSKIEDKLLLVFGIVYFISFLIVLFYSLNSSAETLGFDFRNRIFGKYAFAYWMFPILYIIVVTVRQLNVKRKRVTLYLFSFISILPMEKIVISMAENRNYLSMPVWPNRLLVFSNIWMPILRNYLICGIIYYLILQIIYRIQKNTNFEFKFKTTFLEA